MWASVGLFGHGNECAGAITDAGIFGCSASYEGLRFIEL